MEIKDILLNKREQLMRTGNPCDVTFTLDEINTLSDLNALRCFSIREPFPEDFVRTNDPFTCASAIIQGDSIYRIMEFCLIKNRALKNAIPVVFSAWRD